MTDIRIRREGRAGRITFARPKALNALTHEMTGAIGAALRSWAADDRVAIVVIDAEGERAFCAGGDIAEIYRLLSDGEYDRARDFWREEYPVNAAIANFPKPIASFMQGYTMGGGVGIGCHASHRVVGETSRIAMPECGIGLIPDVGGTLLLARAPGRAGEYLGATGARMEPGDAIHAGFADSFIPEAEWPGLIAALTESGAPDAISRAARPAPQSRLAADAEDIDRHFSAESFGDILASLENGASDFCAATLEKLAGNAPLAMASTVALVRRARGFDRIEPALEQEFRYAYRAADQGDFREGIRAVIIDKDRAPRWRHAAPGEPTSEEVAAMIAPLGDRELKLEDWP